MEQRYERARGITLIALVITIIILLLLAGISIGTLTGENGILTKATQAGEKYKIETAREKIQLAVQSYEIDKEKTTLYDELLKVEGLTYIDPSGENQYDGPPYTVIVDGYEFIVQKREGTEALEVIYKGEAQERKEAPEISVDYDKDKVENLKLTIIATTKDEQGLKQIIVSKKRMDGENIIYENIYTENIQGNKEKTIQVQIPANGEYVIQAIGQNDTMTKQEVTIDNIVNATIVATVRLGEVIDNHVAVTITGQNTEIPIKAIELYVEGQKVKTYEYEDPPMEKEEIYTISNMEFYKNISCYAKVINTKGKEGTSSTVTTMNASAIATATDLKNLAVQVNNKGNTFQGKTVRLIADIDLNGSNSNQWTAIGNASQKFRGTFIGNKHQINRLVIQGTNNYQGLFGYVENATITGVILGNASNVAGKNCVGGIVGYGTNSTIQNCANYGNIYGRGELFAGIIGNSEYSTITGCVNYGVVQDNNEQGGGTARIGGIAGTLESSTISYSYNEGSISGGYVIGGIAGRVNNRSKVYYCYNKGKVTAWGGEILENGNGSLSKIGGIVGILRYYGEIKYCYNLGNVTSNKSDAKNVGGICGRAIAEDNASIFKKEYATKIQYCYNSGVILSKGNQIGGCCGTNLQSCYVTNCYVSSNIVVTGKMMTAVNNIGADNKGFTGRVVGYSHSESLPYCGNFGNITTETVYYVVNGLNSGNSQYWSKANLNAPKLIWE